MSKIFVSGRLFSDSCKFLYVSDSNAQIDGRPNNHSLYHMHVITLMYSLSRLYVSQKVDLTARLRSLVSVFEIKGAFFWWSFTCSKSDETCSKLAIEIAELRHSCRSDVFIINFAHVSHLVLVFLLLTG